MPDAWLINNADPTDVEYAKNACMSIKEENGVNKEHFAWVTETGGPGSCKNCGNEPTSVCGTKNRDPFTNDAKYTGLKGDCPGQDWDPSWQTCCYAKTQETDFYKNHIEETTRMVNKCKELNGSFTGPTSQKMLLDLGFPDLTDQTNGSGISIADNELFCYYNDSKTHPEEHKKYCGNMKEYEDGHGYFCSFPPTPAPTPAPGVGGKTDCNAYLSIRSCPGPPDCQWDLNNNRCKSVSAPSPPPSNKSRIRHRR